MTPSAPPVHRPLAMRAARLVVVALIVFLALCAISAIAVPLVIQHLVLDRVGDAVGRQVDIERTRFNPFTLTLTAGGVRIAEQDAAADFVTIDQVVADLSIASVRHLAPVVDALRIETPVVRLQRLAQDRFNFSDIVERVGSASAEPASDGEPARFALRDLELVGGEVTIDDRVLGQTHRITDLQAAVPFISSLDDAAGTAVEPRLSALVNGSSLQVGGTSLPFSETRATSLDVAVENLAVGDYLGLSPVPLGFSIPEGRLSTRLVVRLAREGGDNLLALSGSMRIEDLEIQARNAGRLVVARRLALGIDGIEPMVNRYHFGELEVEGLAIDLTRSHDGTFPLVQAFTERQATQGRRADAPAEEGARVAGTSPATASGSRAPDPRAASKGTSPAGSLEWRLRKTTLREGRVDFRDETVEPAVALAHRDIAIDLAEIGNRQAAPAAARLSLRQGDASTLSWQGELDLAKSRAGGQLDATVASIEPYLPYVGDAVAARLASGTIAAAGELELGWRDAFTLAVAKAQASVENWAMTLPNQQKPTVAVARLAVDGVSASLADRTVQAASARLEGADIELVREADGTFNLQRLVRPAADDAPAAAGSAVAAPAAESAAAGEAAAGSGLPWKVRVDQLDLEGNRVAFQDLGAAQPVSLPVTQLAGSIGPIGTDLAASSRVDLRASVGGAGMLEARGDFSIEPLSLQLALQLRRLALATFDPYLADRLALSIDEGSFDTTGELRFDNGRVAYAGRLEVAGLRSRERDSDMETIRWKRLLLDGIDIDLDPARLGPEDRIAIGGITLSDFFARVVLGEDGRFNLQDIVRPGGLPPAAAGPASEASASPETPPASASTPGAAAEAAGPAIRIGAIRLEQGRSNFTDRFVKPNYSVNLTDLEGGLSAMASDAQQPADVTLTGRVDGSAPIDIAGQLDPLGSTLFADIRARANGIDLPSLTPYSAKYAGYTIEKGKLTLDVHYRIEDERLEAQNRVVLDQLTFGDKVESPDATNLPLQFALGLLKNGKGEIDVNLPIAGSLDDPQFSIGGIIGNAIANLLTRVVTAPFSALAAAFGGGKEELSYVRFAPGSARLPEESVRRLQVMAKALNERPALKLEIAGRVDPRAEGDAMRRERLDARLRALKRREKDGFDVKPGETQERQEEAASAAGITVSAEEYPALLRRLYEEAGSPGKEEAAPAADGSLDVPMLEQLLLASIEVDGDAAWRLGNRRAQAVQRWLVTRGKVPEDRIFTLAPRIDPSATGPNQSKPQCSAGCAEFSLR